MKGLKSPSKLNSTPTTLRSVLMVLWKVWHVCGCFLVLIAVVLKREMCCIVCRGLTQQDDGGARVMGVSDGETGYQVLTWV